jgi:ubiquinone/menaquinone biosynthesis C-methylase UbiE
VQPGAKVADVGRGLDTSTILMAEAFPKSTFVGFDYHPKSIELAREAAAKTSAAYRVKFKIAEAKDFPGKGYQMVAFFDCLHDMGDPEGAAETPFNIVLEARP